jgi:hypothetical protein
MSDVATDDRKLGVIDRIGSATVLPVYGWFGWGAFQHLWPIDHIMAVAVIVAMVLSGLRHLGRALSGED